MISKRLEWKINIYYEQQLIEVTSMRRKSLESCQHRAVKVSYGEIIEVGVSYGEIANIMDRESFGILPTFWVYNGFYDTGLFFI